MPPARPSGSRGQPPSPPRAPPRRAAAPAQAPPLPKGVSSRGNGEDKQEPRLSVGGTSLGRRGRGGRPSSSPLPSPSLGSPSRRILSRHSSQARQPPGQPRRRAKEGSRHRLPNPPQPRGSSRPQPVLGEVLGVYPPLFISCRRGHVYKKNGKDGLRMRPSAGTPQALFLRGTASTESSIPVPRIHTCPGESAAPGRTCLKLPPRTVTRYQECRQNGKACLLGRKIHCIRER